MYCIDVDAYGMYAIHSVNEEKFIFYSLSFLSVLLPHSLYLFNIMYIWKSLFNILDIFRHTFSQINSDFRFFFSSSSTKLFNIKTNNVISVRMMEIKKKLSVELNNFVYTKAHH